MANILTIHSFKGGSGKSIIASAIAYHCSHILKEKTLLVDCDFEAPSLNTFFPSAKHNKNNNKNENTIVDYLESDLKLEVSDVIIQSEFIENLSLIYAPDPTKGKEILTMDEQWYVIALRKMISAIKVLTKDLQYKWIIFDNQSGLSRSSTNFLLLSTSTILILRPSQYAVEGTLSLIKSLFPKLYPYNKSKRKDILIWNQIPTSLNDSSKHKEMFQLINVYNKQFKDLNILPVGNINYDNNLAISLFLKELIEIGEIFTFFEPSIQKIIDLLADSNTII